MNKMPSSIMSAIWAVGIIFFISCSKQPLSWDRMPSGSVPPGCDTCARPGNSVTATNSSVILNPQKSDWTDLGNGRFECNLGRLLQGHGGSVDSLYITMLFIGSGIDAVQIKQGSFIIYGGNSLAWSGDKLDFQNPDSLPPPESLIITLDLILFR